MPQDPIGFNGGKNLYRNGFDLRQTDPSGMRVTQAECHRPCSVDGGCDNAGKQPTVGLLPRRLRSGIEGLRQPIQLGAFLPFDSGENAINPNNGILKISKQISDSYPFTINADQTEIPFTLNQNRSVML